MTTTEIEKRLTAMEPEIADLKTRVMIPPTSPNHWIEKMAGSFAGPDAGAAFDEAMRYGRERRVADRPSRANANRPGPDPSEQIPVSPDHQNNTFETALSWTAMVLVILTLAFMAWFVPTEGNRYRRIFDDFHTELPFATRMAVSIPSPVFVVAAGLAGAFAVIVQVRVVRKSSAALSHLLLLVLCLIAYFGYAQCMRQAFEALMGNLSGG